MFNEKQTQECIEWYRLRIRPLTHIPFMKCLSKYAHRGFTDEDIMLWGISNATELVREGCKSRNWDLIGEALEILKIYDPEVEGEEESKELELADEMDDNVPVWLPSRPYEGPSNTQHIIVPAAHSL
ncbi:hypothetical protein AMTR_s00063p00188430 [Amborella trichopoda]|uniref:Uncharacterized protein n=1 Tax=Amborella trichopoda TaxID=13333 RepID=U5D7E7_AMBTC|nr:hypothetical protein AMTR_s00063p00188430 [Amborella trichopoda]